MAQQVPWFGGGQVGEGADRVRSKMSLPLDSVSHSWHRRRLAEVGRRASSLRTASVWSAECSYRHQAPQVGMQQSISLLFRHVSPQLG